MDSSRSGNGLSRAETEEQREKRLQHRRERDRGRRASETKEMRNDRLAKRRSRDRTRRTAHSGSAQLLRVNEARLQRQHERLASETDDERET